MNHVCLIGTVLRDPTTRFEGAGHQVTDFVLSVLEPSTSPERKAYHVFIACTSWGKSAEACSLLQEEDQVAIVGKLTWYKRVGKCKTEHSVLCVSVKEVTVLSPVLAPVPSLAGSAN